MSQDQEEDHFLEKLNRDLALALGDAIWAFARIEWLTYECLRRLSSDGLDELVLHLNFRPRTTMIRRIVERRSTDRVKIERALQALQSVDELSDKRNTIVHNPWQIWIDLEAKEFMTEIQRYATPNRKLNLDDLRSFAQICGAAEEELRVAVNAL